MPAPDAATVPADLAADHALLVDAVREAGALALRYFKTELETWDKGGGDPVSEADLAVDRLLHERLRDPRPNYGWLSEETEDEPARLACDRVWVIDPIDGTRAFLKHRPHFTVCAALVEHGRPVSAAVFNPALDEFFEATKGGGARLNGEPIHVSDCDSIEGCRMCAFAPMFKHPAWPEPWPEMEVENRNSVAYRLALVACGQFDAMMALNRKNDWDLAAADLIVHEAHGRMTRHDGTLIFYNTETTRHRSVMAAGPKLYARLFEKVGRLKLPD